MGADLNARVPLDRWDVDQYYSPDLASKKMYDPQYYPQLIVLLNFRLCGFAVFHLSRKMMREA